MQENYFDGLIGQAALKRKLSFYLDAFKETRKMPFLLFAGPKGSGKNKFAKSVAKVAKNADGTDRIFLEVNCSILKNLKTMVEAIYLPYIANQTRGLNMMLDEAHNLPNDISQALLTICNSDPDPCRQLNYDDSVLHFDFTKISFFFGTTETDKIFPPLKDRFETVDFEPYSKDDLRKIISMNADETVFQDNVLDVVAEHVRGNARSCVKMAENITTYCKKVHKTFFGQKDWKEMAYQLGILPFGLTNSEVMILRELNRRGPCSLNMLASATGLSRTCIQHETEQYLLRGAYLVIDGKRKITEKGQKVLQLV